MISNSDFNTIIFGGGGHCASLLCVLNENRNKKKFKIKYIVDDHIKKKKMYDLKIITSKEFSLLNIYPKKYYAILAIGDNIKRKKIYISLKKKGFNLPNIISEKAIVNNIFNYGNANQFLNFTFTGALSEIGNNNIFNTSSVVEHNSIIGSHNHIAPNATILGNVKIGNSNLLGANSTILNNVRLNNNLTIGAGSVVIRSISKSNMTITGIPGKKS